MRSLTRRAAYLAGRGRLLEAGVESPGFDAKWLLVRVCGAYEPALDGEKTLSEDAARDYFARVARRCAGEPLQYILGEWEFYSLPFAVRAGVLIPRPETELLAERALALLEGNPAPAVLDLCTGSGCVAAVVAKHIPDARVTAAELYDVPLEVAAENFRRLGLVNIALEKADALEAPPARWAGKFDLLVSNPPYVPRGDLGSLARELAFEPAEALDGGDDGLIFYRAIADKWASVLRGGGKLALEIGFDQAARVAALLARHFTGIETYRDYAGRDRVVTATKN